MVYLPTCTIKIYKLLVNISFPWMLWDIYVYINTWKSKQPLFNGCFVKQSFFMERFGIIQLKQPFINGCLGFQVYVNIYHIYTVYTY